MDASSTLPNEVWIQILGHLSKKDLKALRVCGGDLTSLASSLLFSTAYVAARKGVLDTFTALTTHPIFRHHVKEVIFDSSWIDPETVSEYVDHKCGPSLAALFHEQEDIQVNKLQLRLENAFQCLSNVRKVCYADLSRVSCLPGDRIDPYSGCDYWDGPLIRRLESGLWSRETGLCCSETENTLCCPCHKGNYRFRRQ